MPLDPGKLKSQLEKVFASPQSQTQPAAQGLAAAYAAYAQDGGCGGTASPVGISASKKNLEIAINAAYVAGGPLFNTVNNIGSALVAFWLPITMLPPIAGATGPGVIAAPPVPPTAALMAVMGSQLATAMSGAVVTVQQNAASWATALDSFTRTVIFTFPSGSGPVPMPVV